jgi:hypothetical protein
MIRSVAAVAAGFATMVILVMMGTFAWVAVMVPGGMAAMRQNPDMANMKPSVGYLAMNLTLSFVAALLAGWITTRVASGGPVGHLVALACLVLVMSVVSAMGPGSGQQPGWYKVAIPLIGLAGLAMSAWLATGRAAA